MLKAMKEAWNKQEYTKVLIPFAVVGGLIGAGMLGWFGYSWFSTRFHERAFADYLERVDAYRHLRQAPGRYDEQAVQLAEKINADAEKYKNTSLYPFFRAYQSQALLDTNRRDEALALLDDAIAHLVATPLIRSSFQLKRAVIKIDASDNEALQRQGVAELEAFAADSAFPMQDLARYHLAERVFAQGDVEAARGILKELEVVAVPAMQKRAQDRLKELDAAMTTRAGKGDTEG